MNTVSETLMKFKSFLETELNKADYKLPMMNEEGQQGEKFKRFVVPAVRIDQLPHQNFAMYTDMGGRYFSAPYVQIGFDEESTDTDGAIMGILIQVCTVSSQYYDTEALDEDEQSLKLPDNEGYRDCLALLEFIKRRIINQHEIGGTTVEYPVRLGSYSQKQLTYPYNFGYVSFDVNKMYVKADVRKKLLDY